MSACYLPIRSAQLPPTPPYTERFNDEQLRMQEYLRSQSALDGYRKQRDHHGQSRNSVNYSSAYAPPQPQQPSYQSSHYVHNLPPISSYYEPMGAPILPPLRMQTGYHHSAATYYRPGDTIAGAEMTQQSHQAAPKEEQATGGVSAKLDYDMERMTDFVAEAASGIIQPGTAVHPAFRKWVSQVLAATRLPSATILLSLHYLTVRMRQFPSSIDKSDQQLYRLLAVSMILGSKFLDDNTFINRSWSDVSGIKVSELNALEIQWLALIGFDLHADNTDENGISLWLRAWKDYASGPPPVKATRLSPLNTNFQRHDSLVSSGSGYQPGYVKTAQGMYTPLSTHGFNSAANTPYVSADPWNPADLPSWQRSHNILPSYDFTGHLAHERRTWESQAKSAADRYNHTCLPPMTSYDTTYYSPWNQDACSQMGAWSCPCDTCLRRQHFGPVHTYAPQAVIG